jgi:hypothetical protein
MTLAGEIIMNCPNCHQPNVGDARFCAQCGTPLAQAATPPPPAAPPRAAAPAARASGSNKLVLIILGVVFALVLVVGIGVYAVFHMVANKVRSLANAGAQTSSQNSDTQQGAAFTGNVIGGMLGTDAKGKSDIANALNNMAKAGQQIEQRQQASGGQPNAADTQQAMNAAGGLLSAMGHSLGGAQRHDPVDFRTLQALLPTSLPGLQRGTPQGVSDAAMGIKTTEAAVDFSGPDGAQVHVGIKDAAAFSGIAGLAAMANAHESEQGNDYERNETLGGRSVHEVWESSGKSGKLSVLVGKRFAVTVNGYGVDMDVLKGALAQVDLDKLEAMKDANPVTQ